jgi:hypothetical protein
LFANSKILVSPSPLLNFTIGSSRHPSNRKGHIISALQSAQGAPPPHVAVAAPDPAPEVNYVGSSGPSGSRGSNSHSHSQAASENSMGRQQSEGYRCNICGEKNLLARTCSFRSQVDALVQRHKRDFHRSGGQRPRNPKKNKARHGFSSACDSDSDMEEDPISSSESDMPDLLTDSDSEDEEEIKHDIPPRSWPPAKSAHNYGGQTEISGQWHF